MKGTVHESVDWMEEPEGEGRLWANLEEINILIR
jgi:hypothetical protein